MKSDDEGVGLLILIFALGCGFLVADLTPGVDGPGWIAFAAAFAAACFAVTIVTRRRGRR